MPLTRHRLDIVLVPHRSNVPLDRDAWRALHRAWDDRGWVNGDGPGTEVDRILVGGFKRISMDQPGRLHLYANHQGGYRVHCGVCQNLITSVFSSALTSTRSGGPHNLRCPYCDANQALEDLDFRPLAAFALWGLVIADVESLQLEQDAMVEAEKFLGELRVILRRVG